VREPTAYRTHTSHELCLIDRLTGGARSNCLREVSSAVHASKPLILVHEADTNAGGCPLEQLREECPPELRSAIFDSGTPVLPWLRKPVFQAETLTCIAEAVIAAAAGKSASHTQLAYMPRSLAACEYLLARKTSVYVSKNNRNAFEVAQTFASHLRSGSQVYVTANSPLLPHDADRERSDSVGVPQAAKEVLTNPAATDAACAVVVAGDAATHAVRNTSASGWLRSLRRSARRRPLLAAVPPSSKASVFESSAVQLKGMGMHHVMMVYLEPDVFCGEAGELLASEVSRMHASSKVRVILVHPIELCPFNRIIDTCPRSLLEAGLFNDLAVELRTGRYEAVSAALFAKALGASKAFPRRWKEEQRLARRRSSAGFLNRSRTTPLGEVRLTGKNSDSGSPMACRDVTV